MYIPVFVLFFYFCKRVAKCSIQSFNHSICLRMVRRRKCMLNQKLFTKYFDYFTSKILSIIREYYLRYSMSTNKSSKINFAKVLVPASGTALASGHLVK